MVRSVSSCGLGVLRQIEDQLLKRAENLTVTCAREVAYYLLNEKRDSLLVLEQTYGITVFVVPAIHDMKGTQAVIERAHDREPLMRRVATTSPVHMDSALTGEPDDEDVVDEADAEEADTEASAEETTRDDAGQNGEGGVRRKRRRGRRGGRRNDREREEGDGVEANAESDPQGGDHKVFDGEDTSVEPAEGSDTEQAPAGEDRPEGDGRQRRGRRDRFGRQRGRRDERPEQVTAEGEAVEAIEAPAEGEAEPTGERPPREDRGGRGGGRRDRGPRADRSERGENREARPPREGRPPRESREQPQLVAPSEPAFKLEIPDSVPEPEVRKWVPPTPTIQADAVPKKGGWWNKRS